MTKQFVFVAAFIFIFVTQIMPMWKKSGATPGGLVLGLLLAIGGALAIAHFSRLATDKKVDEKISEETEKPEGAANGEQPETGQVTGAANKRPDNKKGGNA